MLVEFSLRIEGGREGFLNIQYGACERNHAQNYSFKVDFWPHLITPPQSGKF